MSDAGRIPVWITSFLGREADLAVAENLLAGNRLVTFTGAGGCGKTRLAAELARRSLAAPPEGIRYVDLAPLREAVDIPEAVRVSLALPQLPGVPATTVVLEHLAAHRALLVLDNCEHLLDGVRPVVADLLAECPDVRVLATSREPLALPGEANYRVPSLTVPVGNDDVDCAAVALFTDRARLARAPHGFAESAVPAVLEICRRLDGMPLAIELAAARCGTLTPDQILAQLSERLEVLTARTHGTPPRHQTLEASIAWSYQLLNDAERRVLRAMAVSSGTFTAASAVSICRAAHRSDRRSIEATTATLVDRGLIESPFGTPRMRLLQTVRQFLLAELTAHGELAALSAAHAEITVTQAEVWGAKLATAEGEQAHAEIESEIAEIRAADDWLFESRDAARLFRLHGALRLFWFRAHPQEGCDRARRAVSLTGGTDRLRALALLTLIEAGQQSGQWSVAADASAHALELADHLDDPFVVAQVQAKAGFLRSAEGDARGAAFTAAAVESLSRGGEPYWLVDGLWSRGLIAAHSGDSAGAITDFARALRLAEEIGHEHATASSAMFLGLVLTMDGRYAEGGAELERSLRIFISLDEHMRRYFSIAGLALVQAATGNPTAALDSVRPAHGDASSRHQVLARGWVLWVRVLVEHMVAAPGEALPSLELVDTAMPTQHGGLWMWNAAWCEAIRAERCAAAGDRAAARAALSRAGALLAHPLAGRARARLLLAEARVRHGEEGAAAAEEPANAALRRAQTDGHVPQVIEALEVLGALSAERGHLRHAARLLGAAGRGREVLGSPRPPSEAAALASVLDRIAGEADAWQQGRSMTLEQAAAYAARERDRGEIGTASLTPAERQVARLAASGMNNAEIAATLVVSVATVKTHLNRSFHKLGLQTRAELAALADELG